MVLVGGLGSRDYCAGDKGGLRTMDAFRGTSSLVEHSASGEISVIAIEKG